MSLFGGLFGGFEPFQTAESRTWPVLTPQARFAFRGIAGREAARYFHPFEMDDATRVALQGILQRLQGQTGEYRAQLLEALPEGVERSPAVARALSLAGNRASELLLSSILPLLAQQQSQAQQAMRAWSGQVGQRTEAKQWMPTESPGQTLFRAGLSGLINLFI
jgi:hypothetical protein